jgi:hypothetical protein
MAEKRKGPLAGSQAERLLLARGPRAGVEQLKEGLDGTYDVTLDQFYDRVFSNTSPEIRRFMEDSLSKLPPERQLQSLGGLMALIGYGAGDNTATVSRYNVKENQYGPNTSFLTPTTQGYYPRKEGGGNLKEYKGRPVGMSELEWAEGAAPPQPGAGVAVFSPTQDDPQGVAQAYRDNQYNTKYKGRFVDQEYLGGTPTVLVHELMHRGYENPIKAAFEQSEETELADRILKTMGPTGTAQHSVIRALDLDDGQKKRDYMRYAEALNDFITPEREQEYGVTKYRNPDAMSLLDRLIYGLYQD